MIAKGTKVLVDEPDQYIAIEDLSVGDMLMNPLSGQLVEVVDMRVRTMDIKSVVLLPGATGMPKLFGILRVSTNQRLFWCDPSNIAGRMILRENQAHQVVDGNTVLHMGAGSHEVYYSIYLSQDSLICANGVLCSVENELGSVENRKPNRNPRRDRSTRSREWFDHSWARKSTLH